MDPPMGNWGAPLASNGERRKVSPARGCEGNWRSSAGPWLGRRGTRQTPKARRLVPGMWEIQVSSGRGTHTLVAPGDRAEGRTDAQERPGEHSQEAELVPRTNPSKHVLDPLFSVKPSPGVLPNKGLGQGMWSPKFLLFYPNACLSTGSWKGR